MKAPGLFAAPRAAELRRIRGRHFRPDRVPFDRVEAFLAAAGTRYPVRLESA